MRTTKVLLIESARKNGVTFAASLQRKYEVRVARSGKQGLELAEESLPDVIVLNAASMRTSGDRISARLRAQCGELPIIHIRPEEAHGSDIVADVLLAPPFTSRKLINRIERYVPTAEDEVLEVGPLRLNVDQQTLTAPWNEKKLTPKLVELLQLFLQHHGETLERKHIMQTIWKTDYMGDTRTLDVHIRWLRQVVEPEPRKPRYITTVRGVGYCFKLPDEKSESDDASGKKKKPTKKTQTKSKSNTKTAANAGQASKKSETATDQDTARSKTAATKKDESAEAASSNQQSSSDEKKQG